MSESNLSTLAARLAWARARRGFTQEQLAKAAGVSRDIIVKTETGITRMPRDIADIAKALEISPAWLAFGAERIDTWDGETLTMAERINQLPPAIRKLVQDLLDVLMPTST